MEGQIRHEYRQMVLQIVRDSFPEGNRFRGIEL